MRGQMGDVTAQCQSVYRSEKAQRKGKAESHRSITLDGAPDGPPASDVFSAHHAQIRIQRRTNFKTTGCLESELLDHFPWQVSRGRSHITSRHACIVDLARRIINIDFSQARGVGKGRRGNRGPR